jgi:hypothetical protein
VYLVGLHVYSKPHSETTIKAEEVISEGQETSDLSGCHNKFVCWFF